MPIAFMAIPCIQKTGASCSKALAGEYRNTAGKEQSWLASPRSMASSRIPATCAAAHTFTLRVLLAAGAALATELRAWSCILAKAATLTKGCSNVLPDTDKGV
jgi:hypothetical protein